MNYKTQGFGPRVVAYAIDVILTSLIFGFFLAGWQGFIKGFYTAAGRTIIEPKGGLNLFEIVCSILLNVFYFTLCEAIMGATLGKLLLRLRVIKTDGTSLGFRAALIRSVVRVFDGILFGIPASIRMQRNPLHQRLGDTLASSIVVDKNDLPSHTTRSAGWLLLIIPLYCFASLIVSIIYARQYIIIK